MHSKRGDGQVSLDSFYSADQKLILLLSRMTLPGLDFSKSGRGADMVLTYITKENLRTRLSKAHQIIYVVPPPWHRRETLAAYIDAILNDTPSPENTRPLDEFEAPKYYNNKVRIHKVPTWASDDQILQALQSIRVDKKHGVIGFRRTKK